MGIAIGFPLKWKPIEYHEQDNYNSSGKRRTVKRRTSLNIFEQITERFFESIINERHDVREARRKFEETDITMLTRRFPLWNASNIMDFRAQFQTFDLNQDGLIDFHELCIFLDDMGDTSNIDTRRHYFDEIDEDGSEAVDFEEFLQLIHNVTNSEEASDTIGALCHTGSEKVQQVRRLSIVQQMQAGLF